MSALDHLVTYAKSVNARVSPYGYTPSLSSTTAYLSVFLLLTLIHLGLAIKFKYWAAMATMFIGGSLEVLGWAARLWSHKDVLRWSPYLMQTCCLILGPVFFSAWDYTLLGACITRLGPQFSLLGAKWYIIIFIIADVISLVLQAIGGGEAAVKAQDGVNTKTWTHVMLSGILFQLATTTIFVILAIDFMIRATLNRPYNRKPKFGHRQFGSDEIITTSQTDPTSTSSSTGAHTAHTSNSENIAEVEKINTMGHVNGDEHGEDREKWLKKSQWLLLGVAWATIMIYARGIYRSIELSQGWTGYVITHEVFFIWLDGFPMVLCMAGLVVAHPGWLLPRRKGWKHA